eukprot:m.259685 g.259685  ORF g.259685 m.259685 type:complete len:442 (+) comp22815_c0_seq1:28-1353(+)
MADSAPAAAAAAVGGPAHMCVLRTCSKPVALSVETAIRLAIPVKALKRVAKGIRATLVVDWSGHEAWFHGACWDRVLKEAEMRAHSKKTRARSTSQAPKPAHILTDADVSLVLEVSETAERGEGAAAMREKAREIARLMKEQPHTVVFTGAGISASAGIPTYRGVDGLDVATEFGYREPPNIEAKDPDNLERVGASTQQRGRAKIKSSKLTGDDKPNKRAKKSKAEAEAEDEDPAIAMSEEYLSLRPTPAHRLLGKWVQSGLVDYIITQNCDDLHHKGGVPRDHLSELHGNVFVEYCETCRTEYCRPYCVDLFSTSCKQEPWYRECPTCHWGHYTGRVCEKAGCKGKLRDTIVNFGDDLHTGILGGLDGAEAACRRSRLVICVGSSLTVTPACSLPEYMPRGGKIVICNLQRTDLDGQAHVRVWGQSDILFTMVDEELIKL